MRFGDGFSCWRWRQVGVGVGVGVRCIHYHHFSHLAQLVLAGFGFSSFMYCLATYDPICLTLHTHGIMELFCWILTRRRTSDPSAAEAAGKQ